MKDFPGKYSCYFKYRLYFSGIVYSYPFFVIVHCYIDKYENNGL